MIRLFRRRRPKVEILAPAAVEPPASAHVVWEPIRQTRDAQAAARAFALRKFGPNDRAWYSTRKFADGHFWEVHQGGAGLSYLPGVVEALNVPEPGKVWIPSEGRALEIVVRNGRPVCALLTENRSAAVMTSGIAAVPASGRMNRVVKSGMPAVYAGAAALLGGVLVLGASGLFWLYAAKVVSINPPVAQEHLPHRQWGLVREAGDTRWVQRLEYTNGRWSVLWRDAPRRQAAPAQPPADAAVVPASVPASAPVHTAVPGARP
ncbi:hypothetical protein AX289_09580 [Methylorubrum populi]|nr:hypothetical protein AX289_09580 [Methylorubrum populi]